MSSPYPDDLSFSPPMNPQDYVRASQAMQAMFPQLQAPGQLPNWNEQGEEIPMGVYSQGQDLPQLASAGGYGGFGAFGNVRPQPNLATRIAQRGLVYGADRMQRMFSGGGRRSGATGQQAGMPGFGSTYDPSIIDPSQMNQLLGHFGLQMPQHINPFLMFNDQSGLGANHPRIARAIEGGLLGAMTPGGETIGQNISNVARTVMGIPGEYAAHQQAQLMAPFGLAKEMQGLRSEMAQEDYHNALAANARDKTLEQAQIANMRDQLALQKQQLDQQKADLDPKLQTEHAIENYVGSRRHEANLRDRVYSAEDELADRAYATSRLTPTDIAASIRGSRSTVNEDLRNLTAARTATNSQLSEIFEQGGIVEKPKTRAEKRAFDTFFQKNPGLKAQFDNLLSERDYYDQQIRSRVPGGPKRGPMPTNPTNQKSPMQQLVQAYTAHIAASQMANPANAPHFADQGQAAPQPAQGRMVKQNPLNFLVNPTPYTGTKQQWKNLGRSLEKQYLSPLQKLLGLQIPE